MTQINHQHKKRLEYIAAFLRNHRLNVGKTQNDLSESTDSVHRNTIVRAEAAKNISLLKLFQMLDALELSPQDLFLDVD